MTPADILSPELLARLEAAGYTVVAIQRPDVLAIGNIVIDAGRQEIRCGSQTATFPTQLMALLLALARQQGVILATHALTRAVYARRMEPEDPDAVVKQQIHLLRRRLLALGADVQITTIWGRGYRLEAGNGT